MAHSENETDLPARRDFLRQLVVEDVAAGHEGGRVHTRFPPEPNGYLHIGHAKAICINFGIAEEFGGTCNLRFDDTNPAKEESEYVEAIEADIRWLGFDWGEHLYFASDRFEALYELAEQLVESGVAYVCDLDAEATRAHRGGVTGAGTDSPYRERGVDENLDLLRRMRAGEFEDGARTLRAKIDMASPNLNLRDPVLYRIARATHHRTGDDWCIYPMYDWAHGQCDALEGITHSLCSLEFEVHRPLYDWFLDHLDLPHRPRQIEFARLALTHTIVSKRKLVQLVADGHVEGWDDPRMPTLRGLRRRGYTASSIRALCELVGVTKTNSVHDAGLLDGILRDELNRTAPRKMAVLDPLKLVIETWPEGEFDEVDALNNPEDEAAGTRKVPFGRELWVEREDFREEPPRKWRRLAPGTEVRLRYGYYVTVVEVVKDADGEVTELRASHDPASRGGNTADERKVRGTIHWVSAEHALEAEVRLYDHLFAVPEPWVVTEGVEFTEHLNPESRTDLVGCRLEPSLGEVAPGEVVQFERKGYFCADPARSQPGAPAFHRTVALRDSWARIEARGRA